jgi:hypothetical protein
MYKYEMLVIPTPIGLCKVFVYGFLQSGTKSWTRGKVYASINDTSVSGTGYNRKRTIIKVVDDLYNSIINKK